MRSEQYYIALYYGTLFTYLVTLITVLYHRRQK